MRSRSAASSGAAPSSGRKSARTRKAGGTPTLRSTSDASLRTASVRISFSSIAAAPAPRAAPSLPEVGAVLRRRFGFLYLWLGLGRAGRCPTNTKLGSDLAVDLLKSLRMVVQELLGVLTPLSDP